MDRPCINRVFTLAILLLTAGLLLIPSKNQPPSDGHFRVRATVVGVDNSTVEQFGAVRTGSQRLKILLQGGPARGDTVSADNFLMGKLELDKMFEAGDRVLAVYETDVSGDAVNVSVPDHYRLRIIGILAALFVLCLICYAGETGVRAVVTFLFTIAVIWKILLPAFLAGYPPLLMSLGIVLLLSASISLLIGGVSRVGFSAFLGSAAGVLATAGLAVLFGQLFRIHGAVKPFAETLIYSGYPNLDLTGIFLAGIYLASSGAVMDIAMDISAAQYELAMNSPGFTRRQLTLSGLRVGRKVTGTMTTTLLLAYSGGFTALLLVFIGQGTPAVNMINLNYVAAEILHTLTGSFGLVLTAPLTAVIGGFIFSRHNASDSPLRE